jgi:uncharacterized protein YktB (UPF0637 family)
MTVRFSQDDLKIFILPGFKERMAALKEKIRPKLIQLGEEVGPLLMTQWKKEFFTHTAKHLRRTVHPPDETWVAFGPQSRGYKAYIYLAFCLGKAGAQARVVMKTESKMRPILGENLLANKKYFLKNSENWKGLADYTRRDSKYRPAVIRDMNTFLEEMGPRLMKLKTAQFDVGFEVKALSNRLEQEVLKAFESLYAFYECGFQEVVRFR